MFIHFFWALCNIVHIHVSIYNVSFVQGDDHDSSDEEWDAHIGRHARAFLGLNEPVVEIALDDGVGIGMMVRNAFARADNIHARASTSGSSSSTGPDGSLMHDQPLGVGEAVGVSNINAREDVRETAGPETRPLFRSTTDPDMQSNSTSSLVPNVSDSGDSENLGICGDGPGSGEPGSSADDTSFGTPGNGEPEGDFSDSSSDADWDASNDNTSDGEDLEDLLGQIPNDRMGSNPDIDIAATLPLYEGSTLSMLCATLLIVNCCKTHGVSNMFMNELLMLLSMSILPVGNSLPKTEYEATKILKRLGLAYNMIHACPSGCCLFKGDLEDKEQCPVCEADRYRMCGRSRVPTLILRHFPLIPQLQRMFSSKKLSKLNVWHHFNKSVDGKMRHTADSPQWKFVHT